VEGKGRAKKAFALAKSARANKWQKNQRRVCTGKKRQSKQGGLFDKTKGINPPPSCISRTRKTQTKKDVKGDKANP